MRGTASFLLVTAVVFGLLRLAHVAAPLLFPQAAAGTVRLDDLAAIEAQAGFAPLVPYYRPERLGPGPTRITVRRGLETEVVMEWSGVESLRVQQRRGGRPRAPQARSHPIPGFPGALWWSEGRQLVAQLERDELVLEVRTTLGHGELKRVLRSLRPFGR